ncbi:MAG: hypothetical protein J6T74_05340 [Clostridia bacterium]|nr:hypothetical protein [Clostridia bacterium]
MFKIIFVLVINAYHGGTTTIDFTTLQQCEDAKTKIQETTRRGSNVGMTCIEKQVPLKKTKCKVSNEFARSSGNYYPVALECVEE